jgi:hypothetical protein
MEMSILLGPGKTSTKRVVRVTQAPAMSSANGFVESFARLVDQRVTSLQGLGDDRPLDQIVAHVTMDLEQRVQDYQSRMH